MTSQTVYFNRQIEGARNKVLEYSDVVRWKREWYGHIDMMIDNQESWSMTEVLILMEARYFWKLSNHTLLK